MPVDADAFRQGLPIMLGAVSAFSIGLFGVLTEIRAGVEREYRQARQSFIAIHEAYTKSGGHVHLKFGTDRMGVEVLDHVVLLPTLNRHERQFGFYFARRAVFWPTDLHEVKHTPFSARLALAQRHLQGERNSYEQAAATEPPEDPLGLVSAKANLGRIGARAISLWRQGVWLRRGIIASAWLSIASGALAVAALLGQTWR